MRIIKVDKYKRPFQNCKKIPEKPGIYFLWSDDTLLYIGQSKNINTRIRQHLGDSSFKSVNPIEINFISFEEISNCTDAEKDMLCWIRTKHNTQDSCCVQENYTTKITNNKNSLPTETERKRMQKIDL